MRAFDGYEGAYQEIDRYLDQLSDLPQAQTQGVKLDNRKDTLVLKIYMDKDDGDSYWMNMECFDHHIVGTCAENLPAEYSGRYAQVIFTVDADDLTFISGCT